MAKPRGFGATKKAKDLGQLRGMKDAARAMDAAISPDGGDMRNAPIDEVRPDENNPRQLGVNWQTAQQDPQKIEDPRLRKEVEEIQGLALTIRKIGQRSPCEVVREGNILRIIFGERRYWAARLAEQTSLKVIVLHARPDNVPLVQLIENIQHRQLPIYETILNIRSVIAREAELGEPINDATDLINRAGLSRPSAYRYWKYVDMPKDVEDVLAKRIINTHDELNALLKHATVKARKQAIARFISGGSLDEPPSSRSDSTPRRKVGGRPRTSISFGSTKNIDVAKYIFTALDSEEEYGGLDWSDPSVVTKAWKTLLEKIEQRLTDNG